MSTYLLTWNPHKWPWSNMATCMEQLSRQGYFARRWSCGRTKQIVSEDRVFLLKQSQEPRGIIASGWAASDVYEAPHWDMARPYATARYIDVQFDTLLDPDEPLPRELLNQGVLGQMHWDSQSSGVAIPDVVAERLERLWADWLQQPPPVDKGFLAEEMEPYQTVTEGAVQQVIVNRYERSAQARSICIKCYGYDCAVCGFNFEERYGSLGAQYIHVHHMTPLAEIGGSYELNPIQDLRPVCPNCHAMLHRGTEVLSIAELRSKLLNYKQIKIKDQDQ